MLSAGALVMLPSVAWAESGCSSAFESWSCFKHHAIIYGFGAVPAFVVGAVATLVAFNTVRKAPGWKQAAMVALGLPLAYLNTFISLGLGLIGPFKEGGFIATVAGVLIVLQLVTLGVIGALWTRKPGSDAAA